MHAPTAHRRCCARRHDTTLGCLARGRGLDGQQLDVEREGGVGRDLVAPDVLIPARSASLSFSDLSSKKRGQNTQHKRGKCGAPHVRGDGDGAAAALTHACARVRARVSMRHAAMRVGDTERACAWRAYVRCACARACHGQPERGRRLGADGAGEEAARGAVEGGGARLAIRAHAKGGRRVSNENRCRLPISRKRKNEPSA